MVNRDEKGRFCKKEDAAKRIVSDLKKYHDIDIEHADLVKPEPKLQLVVNDCTLYIGCDGKYFVESASYSYEYPNRIVARAESFSATINDIKKFILNIDKLPYEININVDEFKDCYNFNFRYENDSTVSLAVAEKAAKSLNSLFY